MVETVDREKLARVLNDVRADNRFVAADRR